MPEIPDSPKGSPWLIYLDLSWRSQNNRVSHLQFGGLKNIRMWEQSRGRLFGQECMGSAHTHSAPWVTAQKRARIWWDLSPGLEDRESFFAWVPLARQRKRIAQHLSGNIWNPFNLGELLTWELVQMLVTPWDSAGAKAFRGGPLPLWSVGETILVRPLEFLGSRKQEFWCLSQAWFLLNIYFVGHLPEPFTVIQHPGNLWAFTSPSDPKPLGYSLV